MDVYQVCRGYPHLNLNSLSLAPNLQKLQDTQTPSPLNGIESLSTTVEEIYPWCSASLPDRNERDKEKQLRQRWAACKPLRKCDAYAIEPLPRVLTEASMYFGEQGNFTFSLSISSFLAICVDPYKAAAPFTPQRVKGMWMIAKLLANTAPTAALPPSGTKTLMSTKTTSLQGKISEALSKMDQATMCQVLLELVVYYAPAAHSREWSVFHEAKDLLSDLEALQGRETEVALVRAFLRNPNGVEERRFFELAVLEPIRVLSAFCLEIMDSEFGS
jgi:SET and MYND domain-containing protein